MEKEKLIEREKTECLCDRVFDDVEGFEIKPFGNSAHIIVGIDFLKKYKATVAIGVWKKKRK